MAMRVEFSDRQLELIETDEAGTLNLSVPLIKAARKRLQTIRAAPDERTLRNWKSLHYEQLKGKRKGLQSIRLNEQWRMILKINNRTRPPTVTIIGIEDYH